MSTNKEETRNNVDDEEQKEMDGLLVIANEKDVLQSACVLCVCVSLYIYIRCFSTSKQCVDSS